MDWLCCDGTDGIILDWLCCDGTDGIILDWLCCDSNSDGIILDWLCCDSDGIILDWLCCDGIVLGCSGVVTFILVYSISSLSPDGSAIPRLSIQRKITRNTNLVYYTLVSCLCIYLKASPLTAFIPFWFGTVPV